MSTAGHITHHTERGRPKKTCDRNLGKNMWTAQNTILT